MFFPAMVFSVIEKIKEALFKATTPAELARVHITATTTKTTKTTKTRQ